MNKVRILFITVLSLITFVGCEEKEDLGEVRDKQQLTELVNRVFMYTDARNWTGLQNEVFTPTVYLDMRSNEGCATDHGHGKSHHRLLELKLSNH